MVGTSPDPDDPNPVYMIRRGQTAQTVPLLSLPVSNPIASARFCVDVTSIPGFDAINPLHLNNTAFAVESVDPLETGVGSRLNSPSERHDDLFTLRCVSFRHMNIRHKLLAGIRDAGPVLTNAVLFQVTWFACVIGGAAGEPLWGFAGVLALLGYSWYAGLIQRDLWLLLALGVTGFTIDTVWITLGILDFGGEVLAPSWIVALWLGFGLTVNHSMGWLRQKPLLAASLAALFAPVTYLAGARLGAVEVVNPSGLALISGAWAIMFLLLFSAAAGRQETESVR